MLQRVAENRPLGALGTVSKSLKIGVVGCGQFGKNAYVRNILSFPDAEVVSVCDVNPARIETVYSEHFSETESPSRPVAFSDYTNLLDQELDAVMVGTMADIRPEVSIAALNRGIHVLGAKPMAPTLRQAGEMLDAAKKSAKLFMVGYNFRFQDNTEAMHRFISEGGIGRPMFARAWSHESSVPTWGPHYIKKLSGGGSLASTAVHVIDLALWFLGSPELESVTGHSSSRFHDLPSFPEKLEAVREAYDTEDIVSGHVKFKTGESMTIEGMWLAPRSLNRKGVDVWGSAGYASLEPFCLMSWQDGDYVDRTAEFSPEVIHDLGTYSRLRTTSEVHHFLDCCLGKADPRITHHEMWTNQAIVEGIYDVSGIEAICDPE
jgi:predicted dehydrogenase